MEEMEKHHFYEAMGKKIRRARNVSGLNQTELGKKIGISRVSIVNIEKGKQMPPVHVIWKMSNALHVSVDTLFPNSSSASFEKNVKLIGEEVNPDRLKSIFNQLDLNK